MKSIFEKATAIVDIKKFKNDSAFSYYPWKEDEPITKEEIESMLNSNQEFIKPGIYTDGEIDNTMFDTPHS